MNGWNAVRNAKAVALGSISVFMSAPFAMIASSYDSMLFTGSVPLLMLFFVLLALWLVLFMMTIVDYVMLPPCVRKGAFSINIIKAFAEHQGPPIVFERQAAIRHRERWRRFVLVLFIRDLYTVGIFTLGAVYISQPGLRVLMFVLALFYLALVMGIWRFLATVDTEEIFPDSDAGAQRQRTDGSEVSAVADA